jgi:uncharacterized protein YjdB
MWATKYISYNGNTQDTETTITSSNVSSGTAGKISWTGTSCTYSSSRVNIAANGSITFTASSGYVITKIVIVSGSSEAYYGTWTSSPSVTPTTSSGTTTFEELNANSVTVTTSTAFRCTSASSISIYYTSNSSSPISVTGVTLDESELSLAVGESATLTPIVAPSNATNKNVSWESSNDAIATVVDGEVTAVAEGTATITVTTEDGSKTATCDVTVTPAPAVSATFDFTTNDVWGFPEDEKTVPENTYSNGTYSIKLQGSTGNGYYFDTTNNNLLLGKSGATLTFPTFTFNVKKIVVYGNEGASGSVTFNIFVGSEAVSTSATSSKVTHDFAIEEASQAAGTKYILKVTNNYNMRISQIEVYGYETTPAVTADGWATYVTTNPCRFEEGDAYIVKSASDKVYLQSVTDVPNNTPVLLKGEGAKTAGVLPTASAISNELAISNGGSIDGYVLAKKSGVVGFYKWNGGSLTSGKVYLPSSSVSNAREFLGFSFDENEVTAINEAKSQQPTANGQYYDLQGRKVAKPTKGLYIVNGRKVIVK